MYFRNETSFVFLPYSLFPDYLSQVDNSVVILSLQNRKAVLGRNTMFKIEGDLLQDYLFERLCRFHLDYIAPDENCGDPLSNLYYPILENLDRIEITGNKMYPLAYELRGLLAIGFYWRSLIRNILPEGSDGIVLVATNPCNGTFTYKINGPAVEFLGTGDKHDTKYNYLSVNSSVSNLSSYFEEESQYSGLPLETETCVYTFQVYASDEMKESKFISSKYCSLMQTFAEMSTFCLINVLHSVCLVSKDTKRTMP
jgi:hypothetical protein